MSPLTAETTIEHMLDLPDWLWLIVYALAAVRITGLIVADTILEAPREAFTTATDRRRATRPLGYLVNCFWCTSVWAAAGLVAAAWAWHGEPLFGWAMIALAFSQVAGMLSDIGRE